MNSNAQCTFLLLLNCAFSYFPLLGGITFTFHSNFDQLQILSSSLVEVGMCMFIYSASVSPFHLIAAIICAASVGHSLAACISGSLHLHHASSISLFKPYFLKKCFMSPLPITITLIMMYLEWKVGPDSQSSVTIVIKKK